MTFVITFSKKLQQKITPKFLVMHLVAKSVSLQHHPLITATRIYQTQFGCRNFSHLDNGHHTIFKYKMFKYPYYKTTSLFCISGNTDVLFSKSLSRSVSYFTVHPEKLKQMVKIQNAQSVCNVLESDSYRQRILDFMEQQKSYLSDGKNIGIAENRIKYEHIIDCAQPTTSNFATENSEEDEEKRVEIIVPPVTKKPIRTTVMSALMKKKSKDQENLVKSVEYGPYIKQSTILPIVMEARKKTLERRRKFKRRTTILPIILKNSYDRKVREKKSRKDNNIKSINDKVEQYFVEEAQAETASGNSNATGSRDEIYNTKRHFDSSTEMTRKIVDRKEGKENSEETMDSEVKVKAEDKKKIQKSIQVKKRSFKSQRSTDVFSLFNIVKADTLNKAIPLVDTKPYSTENNSKEFGLYEPSLTYKIVSRERKRRQDAHKNRFIVEKLQKKPSIEINEVMKCKSKKRQNSKDDDEENIISTPKYLIRLPKPTAEGYRILLYSVRDTDPTKMNFSDAVKGFCMYNDAVLSEDGLQEGYIVIFDMKGVQLGHLARVSLPALRCFMMYIQEGHPCRLKAIHILNTASWIHHVMRLVIPLIKSELLSLLKFHKGNLPEGLATELLPNDYGGEAGNMVDLDKETKTLVFKYHKWLIETEQFKSDESKRIKKSSWWGLFGSSKSNNEELDEKTIVKNLQIE